jgi:acyl-CoA synthetase (AMP-forming)/AMP-acid ligase II
LQDVETVWEIRVGQGTLRHLPTAEKRKLQAKQGRPLPLVEMKIVDDGGRELPWDGKTFGALLVRGPYVVDRYYKVTHPSYNQECPMTLDQHCAVMCQTCFLCEVDVYCLGLM